MKGRIAWARLIGLGALLLASTSGGYFLQPLISGNSDAINTVVTIFSILAGFLIAVITFIGDPGASGWKDLQLGKREVSAKLRRHRILFYLYLLTLGLALSMYVVPSTWLSTVMWIERLFVGVAVFVFLASFTLPSSLSQLQMDRYQAALNEQKPEYLKDAKLGPKAPVSKKAVPAPLPSAPRQ